MKSFIVLILVAFLVGCAATGPRYSGSTSITFDSDPGPMVKITPAYPQYALSNQQEGSVTLSFVVGEDGKATNIEVVESAGEALQAATVLALQGALYHPQFSGKTVTVVAEFTLIQ